MSLTQFITQLGAAGSGGESYWYSVFSTSNYSIALSSMAVDSSGNIYAAGGGTDVTVIKLDKNGNLLWDKQIYGGSYSPGDVGGIALDSSGNVYICSTYNDNGFVFKLNSSGTVQWGKRFRNTWTFQERTRFRDIKCDDTYLYIFGQGNEPNNARDIGLTGRINLSTGAAEWIDGFIYSTSNTTTNTGIINSSGNAVALGITGNDFVICERNTSGTIITKTYQNLSFSSAFNSEGSVQDSSGNIYWNGQMSISGRSDEIAIMKISSTYTNGAQWIKGYGSINQNFPYAAIAIDADDNLYLGGDEETNGRDGIFCKLDTSGTLDFGRRIYKDSSSQAVVSLVAANDSIYVLGSGWPLIAKLPSDGSLTGTYGSGSTAFTYAVDTSNVLTNVSFSLSPVTSGNDQAFTFSENVSGTNNRNHTISETITTLE